ncbi:MAG: hypothetical protein ABI934_13025, partial [Actinomycetota bacterium]
MTHDAWHPRPWSLTPSPVWQLFSNTDQTNEGLANGIAGPVALSVLAKVLLLELICVATSLVVDKSSA